jgi:hypothetical protein
MELLRYINNKTKHKVLICNGNKYTNEVSIERCKLKDKDICCMKCRYKIRCNYECMDSYLYRHNNKVKCTKSSYKEIDIVNGDINIYL